jgi:RNase P/RNase MRP subunit p30
MKFVDLHLRPNLRSPEHASELLRKSAELGYSTVGIAFAAEVTQKDVDETRELCSRVELDLVTRVNLAPRTAQDLLNCLRHLRGRFEVISVCCYSKEVARQAAKDQRVDLISFSSAEPRRRFFDHAEAELASKASASLEVEMAPLLCLSGFQRTRLLSTLRKEAFVAKKAGVPIILSSGASDTYCLRRPMDYAYLSYLFGLDFCTAKQAVSENPRAMVERNRQKLSPGYVAPGVYVVKEGKDCRDR